MQKAYNEKPVHVVTPVKQNQMTKIDKKVLSSSAQLTATEIEVNKLF